MFPLLAMLVAVHVAMPICERRWTRGAVVESLDTVYLLALPAVAALTALAISPSREELATQFWWFAAIWLAASLWLFTQRREGMASHAIIGLLMLGFGLAARFRDLPWELVTLGIAVAALALAARRSESRAPARISRRPGAGARRGPHDRCARARRRQHAVFQRAFRRADRRRRIAGGRRAHARAPAALARQPDADDRDRLGGVRHRRRDRAPRPGIAPG